MANLPSTLFENTANYFYSTDDYHAADWVIYGMPMDYTTSFRPGTRSGPRRIREVTTFGLEPYSPYLDRTLTDYRYYDIGDIAMSIGNVPVSLDNIYNAVKGLLADGKRPMGLGGEHLVSYPVIKAMAEKYPDLVVLHFDAHTDLRQEFFHTPYSHATVLRLATEHIKPKNLFQFGIRSGDRSEFVWARENINIFPDQLLEPLAQVIPQIADKPVYITLDIDIVDPAFAPGTGTPEPGGCTSREILKAIEMMRALRVVGMDVVEVAPVYDQTDRTSILAAKIIREAILGFTRA